MTQRIDSFLLDLANRIIVFFNFFGIERKKLALIWIVVISIVFTLGEQFTLENKFKLNIISLVLWLGLIMIGQLFIAIPFYKDESLKRYSFFYTKPYLRIIFSLAYPILAIIAGLTQIFVAGVFPWRTIATFPSVFFYIYIFLGDDPNLPYRFGDILAALMRRIRKVLRQKFASSLPNPPA